MSWLLTVVTKIPLEFTDEYFWARLGFLFSVVEMGTNLRSVLCVFLLLFVVFTVNAQSRRPKNVQVAVKAKWQGTPLLLEAG